MDVLNCPGWPGHGHLDHNTANAPHVALAAVAYLTFISGPNHLTEGGGRESEREGGEEGGKEGSREEGIHKQGEGGIIRDRERHQLV